MKKTFIILLTAAFFIACNEVKVKEKDLDAAGEKIQKTVDKGVDTIGSKLKKLKNKIEADSLNTLK